MPIPKKTVIIIAIIKANNAFPPVMASITDDTLPVMPVKFNTPMTMPAAATAAISGPNA